MMTTHSGSTALVTGASQGLGKELSLELARRGAGLVLVARSQGALDDVAHQVEEITGTRPLVIATDLGEPDGAAAVEAALQSAGVEVDLLINNAGIGGSGPFFDEPLAAHVDEIDLNVRALVALTRLIGPGMLRRDRGGVINIASTVAFLPMPYLANYSATKAFVLSFTEALTEELGETPVRVMIAHPGSMTTNFGNRDLERPAPGASNPAETARDILDDFEKGRTASYPGPAFNRLSTLSSRMLPRVMAARLAARFTRSQGMHKPSQDPSAA